MATWEEAGANRARRQRDQLVDSEAQRRQLAEEKELRRAAAHTRAAEQAAQETGLTKPQVSTSMTMLFPVHGPFVST